MRFEFPYEDIMLIRDCNTPGPEEGPELGSWWTLVSYGASNAHGNGIREIITSHSPQGCVLNVQTIWRSARIVSSILKSTEIRLCSLAKSKEIGILEITRPSYKEHVLKLIPYFDEITFHHIPREENHLEDALATLASMFKFKWKNEAPSFHLNYLDNLAYCLASEHEADSYPWFYDIMRFLECQEYPKDASITNKNYLQKLSSKFFLSGGVL